MLFDVDSCHLEPNPPFNRQLVQLLQQRFSATAASSATQAAAAAITEKAQMKTTDLQTGRAIFQHTERPK